MDRKLFSALLIASLLISAHCQFSGNNSGGDLLSTIILLHMLGGEGALGGLGNLGTLGTLESLGGLGGLGGPGGLGGLRTATLVKALAANRAADVQVPWWFVVNNPQAFLAMQKLFPGIRVGA